MVFFCQYENQFRSFYVIYENKKEKEIYSIVKGIREIT